MALKSLRQQKNIILPSGVPAKIQAMSGKVQRLFTDSKLSFSDKINSILADVTLEVEGLNLGGDEKTTKKEFSRLLVNDRKYILTQARQLSLGNPETFELKTKVSENGVTKTVSINVELISDNNRDIVIDYIMETYEEDMRPIVEQLNQNGGFPTRPYRKQISSYADFDQVRDIEFDGMWGLEGYTFKFRQLTGEMESQVNTKKVNSQSKLLMRALRYRELNSDKWLSVQAKDLDELNLPDVDYLSAQIDYYEGDVDTIDRQEDDMGREVYINILGELSFFFPNGKL